MSTEELEEKRLERLRQVGILDSPDSSLFSKIAEQALELLPGTSIAAISLVDAERQWFKTIVGLDVKETPRAFSFCSHTIKMHGGTMVVEDATKDERFAKNPLVTGSPGIRFYAGVKLMDGIGALCVIGKHPRRASDVEIAKLTKLSQYADIQLMAHGTRFNLR